MTAHPRGRQDALEPLGWTGPAAEWIAMACGGAESLLPRRVHLKPHYLPGDTGSGRLREVGRL